MAYLIGAHLKASFPYHFGIEKESNVRTLLDVVLPLSRFELKYSAIIVDNLKAGKLMTCVWKIENKLSKKLIISFVMDKRYAPKGR